MNTRDWLRNINWAATTLDDCLGTPGCYPGQFAIYDANEDDGPIAVCTSREEAERIVEALRVAAACNGQHWRETPEDEVEIW